MTISKRRDLAITKARSKALASTKRKLKVAITVALREALKDARRRINRIQDVLYGLRGARYVWIKRHPVPRHWVACHRRLVIYKLTGSQP